MEIVPLLVGLFVVLVVGRRAAARRVTPGHGSWIWLFFAPTVLGGLVALWAAGTIMANAPILGVAMTVGACLYLASIILTVGRASRGISAATSPEELESALTVPMTDHLVRLIGATLLGGLIAVVALIVYGVTRAHP